MLQYFSQPAQTPTRTIRGQLRATFPLKKAHTCKIFLGLEILRTQKERIARDEIKEATDCHETKFVHLMMHHMDLQRMLFNKRVPNRIKENENHCSYAVLEHQIKDMSVTIDARKSQLGR